MGNIGSVHLSLLRSIQQLLFRLRLGSSSFRRPLPPPHASWSSWRSRTTENSLLWYREASMAVTATTIVYLHYLILCHATERGIE